MRGEYDNIPATKADIARLEITVEAAFEALCEALGQTIAVHYGMNGASEAISDAAMKRFSVSVASYFEEAKARIKRGE